MENLKEKVGSPQGIDAFLPPEMAMRAEEIGMKKASMGWKNTFALGMLAGAFIALGYVFATTVTAGSLSRLPYGLVRLLAGLTFSLGLILVIIAGAELFTGNNLIVMAWANRKVSTRQILRNWLLVYIGNFFGAVATAVLMVLTGQYGFGGGSVGENVLVIASSKCSLGFVQAITLGMLCNALVCLAVWLCYSARSNTDKILSIIFPVSAFVAAGFEHSVANMYIIPLGLFIKATAAEEFWNAIGRMPAEFLHLNWIDFFFRNLLPVTIGNILGGSVMVGLVYWFVYLRKGLVPPKK